ncbi:mechanosensitive ion channel family protein [Sulfurimonas sp. MAG313]|nr:mechanosensitive ion channel family protein [Sulfurimonas sp. MAG313]MDF1882206.1 mechanosensitive ion channel family protein [Sulfurimonas sp. MAG313]
MNTFNELLQENFFDNTGQQWLISFAILLFFIFLRGPLAQSFISILHKASSQTKNTLDDEIITAIEPPLRLVFILLGLYGMLIFLKLPAQLDAFNSHFFHSMFAFTIFWSLYRVIGIFSTFVSSVQGKIANRFSADLALFLIKGVKLVLVIMGFVVIVQEWGYNFTGFLASLGLGGLAFALAAKDTAANLFGSLVIFSDKPFDVGDWIQTPGVEGTVESIGIRSTRVRTFAKALVAVPNATLANSPITNWSRMTMRRIKMTIGLTYDTNSTQMQNILTQIRQMLKDDSDINDGTILVNFTDFQDSALGIFCYFFTNTTNWNEYLLVREKINLNIMKIVEDNQASFAFPSQSMYIESLPENPKLNL